MNEKWGCCTASERRQQLNTFRRHLNEALNHISDELPNQSQCCENTIMGSSIFFGTFYSLANFGMTYQGYDIPVGGIPVKVALLACVALTNLAVGIAKSPKFVNDIFDLSKALCSCRKAKAEDTDPNKLAAIKAIIALKELLESSNIPQARKVYFARAPGIPFKQTSVAPPEQMS